MLFSNVSTNLVERNTTIADRRLERFLSSHPDVPVLHSFAACPHWWKTRSRWWKENACKVLPNQSPKGIILWKHQERVPFEIIETSGSDVQWLYREEIVVRPVSVYSVEQTRQVRKHKRTQALEDYWEYFCRHSNTRYKVAYLHNGECSTWQGKITEEEMRDHLFGRQEFAVRMGPKTWYIGIDLDLHYGNVNVFLRQLRILLDRFWGRDSWHLQVKRQNANGVHLFQVFDRLKSTEQAVHEVKEILLDLKAHHPDLEEEAEKNNMRPLSKLEIKPTETTALRLPLAPGRIMLLDKQLEMVTYRKKPEPDVVRYISWIKKALAGNAEYMPKEEVYDFVVSSLSKEGKEEEDIRSIIVPPQIDNGENDVHPPSESSSSRNVAVQPDSFKGMKGQAWRQLTAAWSGKMGPDSLNHWIRQLSLYAPFKFKSKEAATQAIETFIEELPDPSFSSRLSNNERDKVSTVIRRCVNLAFDGWKGQRNPAESAEKLQQVWDRWQATGRDPFDKATWGVTEERSSFQDVEPGPDFEWSEEDMIHFAPLSKVLKTDEQTTMDLTKQLIRLISAHPEVPRTWIVDLMESKGVKARSKKLDKPKRFINYLIEIGWIAIQRESYQGRCRAYSQHKTQSRLPMSSCDQWNEEDFRTRERQLQQWWPSLMAS